MIICNRIPAFDGTERTLTLWWSKYQAFAMISGVSEAICDETDTLLPVNHYQEIDPYQFT
jgi:hypothetical protein